MKLCSLLIYGHYQGFPITLYVHFFVYVITLHEAGGTAYGHQPWQWMVHNSNNGNYYYIYSKHMLIMVLEL